MDNQGLDKPDSNRSSTTPQMDKTEILPLIEKTIIANASDLARSGHYQEALDYLKGVVHNMQASPAILDLLARIHAQQGHWKEAEEAWTQALILNPASKEYARGLKTVARAKKRHISYSLIPVCVAVLVVIGIVAIVSIFISHSRASTVVEPTTPLTPTQIITATQSLSPTGTLSPASTISPTNTPSVSPTAEYLTCTVSTGISTGTINVRSGPDFYFKVIGWLSEGEQVAVLGETDIQNITGWVFIYRVPDLKGWVSSIYCK